MTDNNVKMLLLQNVTDINTAVPSRSFAFHNAFAYGPHRILSFDVHPDAGRRHHNRFTLAPVRLRLK